MDKELAKKTATLLGENQIMTKWIVFSAEKFVADTIKSGRLENVRLPMIGAFKVNLRKLKYLTQVKPSAKVKIVKGDSVTYFNDRK